MNMSILMGVKTMNRFWYFYQAIEDAGKKLKTEGVKVHPARWQATDVSSKPEMATYELLNYSFQCPVNTENLVQLGKLINPNLPWADDHFEERVCGQPINPGIQWEKWPYAHSAAKFLAADGGKFNHNYMERYWPRWAGLVHTPTRVAADYEEALDQQKFHEQNHGIYHRYGDLNDILNLLEKDPLTRQAYMPVFFPEDTGGHHGGRMPCSLGYHFIRRNNLLHIVYYLRSCDYVRHFKDDIYLTVRLQLWVLDALRVRSSEWRDVKPGTFTMHITSLHCFVNDYSKL